MITTQSIFADILTKPASSNPDVKRESSIREGSHKNRFNDTLKTVLSVGSKVDSRREITAQKAHTSGQRVENQQSGNIKSYREAVRINEKRNVSDPQQRKTAKSSDDKDIKSDLEKNRQKTVKAKEGIAQEALAQVLGITLDELKSVLYSSGVDPALLMDESNIDVAVEKLSDFLGLNPEQENILKEIMILTQKETEAFIKNHSTGSEEPTRNKSNGGKEEWVKLEGAVVEAETIDVEKMKEVNLTEFASKLKSALTELSEIIDNEPEMLQEQISLKVEDAVSQSNNSEIKHKQSGKVGEESADIRSFNHVKKTERAFSNDNGNSEEDGALQDGKAAEKPVLEQVISKEDNARQEGYKDLQFTNAVYTEQQKESNIDSVNGAHRQEHVARKEIASQVIEKAKVMLSGDKSEMVIDLKPDHLGKLALKVVTERGIVVAKFMAENEQVKAALEANMDTLKESLEKQGFSVQEFSVSVRQDSQKQFNFNGNLSQHSGGNGGRTPSVNTISTTGFTEESRKANPYDYNESSIDLIA